MAYLDAVPAWNAALRDEINQPQSKSRLMSNQSAWTKLCCAMDVIDDTELAIAAFRDDEPSVTAATGEAYLALYGVLQAMFLQQDAVEHLHEALGLTYSREEPLEAIREIRNDSIGHPTNRRNGKSFHFITRIYVSRAGFEIWDWDQMGAGKNRWIDLPKLINDQRENIAAALEVLVKGMRSYAAPGEE